MGAFIYADMELEGASSLRNGSAQKDSAALCVNSLVPAQPSEQVLPILLPSIRGAHAAPRAGSSAFPTDPPGAS